MAVQKQIRLLIAAALVLLLLLIIAALLFVTESAFAVWERLQDAPAWLVFSYGALFSIITATTVWLVWRVIRVGKRGGAKKTRLQKVRERDLKDRIKQAQELGLDIDAAQRELDELGRRKTAGIVQICVLGDISTGKSSIIKALVPEAEAEVSARGGSTRVITNYTWHSPAGDALILTDVPGLHEAGGGLDTHAKEEAHRAHVVVYVCEGDLTRDQFETLASLIELDKPLVVALNKSDQFSPSDLVDIRHRIRDRVAAAKTSAINDVVAISSGGIEEVVRVHPDGSEEVTTRNRPPRVEDLSQALQTAIDSNAVLLESLRDSAVFVLVARHLDHVEREARREQTAELVRQYTRKAIVGALASVSPGADILVQGYLGTRMVKEICAVYDVPANTIDIDRFLELSKTHVGRALPLLLAVAGNGFKAFPGVGTVAGGLMHAVAYGLIFDALGKSLSFTLDTRGAFQPVPAASRFKEQLSDNLEARTRRFAKMALATTREEDPNSRD